MIDGHPTMKTPAVSVLIPTYNYARYLPEAIESVLAQDFADFELIIADDASSDDTVEVCEAYARQDPRIRFFRHEKNLGMVENWNWCLRHACGKYIKYMLADDKFAKPYALRKLVEAIEQRPGISLVTSARALMDAESKTIGVWNPLGRRIRYFCGKTLIRKCLRRDLNFIGEPTAGLFRREDASRGFDKDYRQLVDLEMWFHLLLTGDLIYLPECLCFFRQHSEQQTVQNRKDDCHSFETIKLCCRYIRCYGRYSLFKRIYSMRKKGVDCRATLEYLEAHINSAEYTVCFIRHRLTKPFLNLKKWMLKQVGWKSKGLKTAT